MQTTLPMRFPLPSSTGLPAGITVGSEVGAGRVPYGHAHPDCWGRPWKGILLALDDVRAWAGTVALPDPAPDQLAVSTYVKWCLENGHLRDTVPVLWEFGTIHWEHPATLRTVEADIAAVEAAKELAHVMWGHSTPRKAAR